MGSFKTFLNENEEILKDIKDILIDLDADEVDELGYVLYSEFFSDNDEDDEDALDDYFTIDDVNSMIDELPSDLYKYILDMIADEEEEIPVSHQQSPDITEGELEEGVSRIMTGKQFNRKKRKFMTNTKADLRKTAAIRKRSNRENKASRKKYYRANKKKISSYQTSRAIAIDKGKHKVKLRKKA